MMYNEINLLYPRFTVNMYIVRYGKWDSYARHGTSFDVRNHWFLISNGGPTFFLRESLPGLPTIDGWTVRQIN